MNKPQSNSKISELNIADIEAALNILNPAFATDPTLCWYLSAATPGYNERRYNYLKSYLTFHHLVCMPALGLCLQGELVGVSYFTPAAHAFASSSYSDLGRAILEGCGEESLARIKLSLDAVEAELPAEEVARIEFIAIDPKKQGSGLGGQLLTATLAHLAQNNGNTDVCLETAEKRYLLFYARHGFSVYKTVELPNLSQYLMRLESTNIPNAF